MNLRVEPSIYFPKRQNSPFKNKHFVGGGGKGVPTTKINLIYGRAPDEIYVTQNKSFAKKYAERLGGDGIILEFQIPKSYMKKNFTSTNEFTLMKQGKSIDNYKMFDVSETGMFKLNFNNSL